MVLFWFRLSKVSLLIVEPLDLGTYQKIGFITDAFFNRNVRIRLCSRAINVNKIISTIVAAIFKSSN